MSENPTDAAPSLLDLVRPLDAGAHVTACAFLGDVAAFALGDGGVLLWKGGERHRVEAHPDGSVLSAACDGERLVTGGDDGRVAVTGADGSTRTFAQAGAFAWIDALALHRDGGIAWSSGKTVTARDPKGKERTLSTPSSVRGLAFAPKGYRLAVAHVDGATLWFPNLDTAPERLEWKGAHLDVVWSPDGRFVVTSMQENSLHGWRLQPDKGHMRMSGYPGKSRSLSWTHDGKWLATSGADAVILWPFDSKEGPTGKQPRECGVRPAQVSRVACHPRTPVVAAGFQDGAVLLIRLSDASELLVRPAVKGSGISALAWDARGATLAFGAEDGAGGVLVLP
ncbi:WD40 repeat domain-containing protein [Salinarimonas sp. NSM]|uniref:WD40 repeat domain-containing protein n=1 Tax=Salinarimonas sp. NSM TaxID=3458003 RepID=UPI004036BBDF